METLPHSSTAPEQDTRAADKQDEQRRQDAQRRQIAEQELHTGKSVAAVAAMLGISRQHLYSLLHKWGMDRPPLPARLCVRCGKEFVPASTCQKKCAACPSTRPLPLRDVREILQERWQHPEYREKMLAHIHSAEHRARVSQCAKERWQDPEFRERIHAKLQWTAERRKKHSQRLRACWQDPEFRKQQGLKRARPRPSTP